MLLMGSNSHHDGYWNPAMDSLDDHRFEWSITADPTCVAMRNMVREVVLLFGKTITNEKTI